ncbi:MAG: N-formylglutamate amidohydrolase [Geminicoccaceae bacterium]|nr:MAG: N-formylglutamate amidohydrolase [Geminicoccaceae bacterium]
MPDGLRREELFLSCIAIRSPVGPAVPLVVAVPHAGSRLSWDMPETVRRDQAALRALQDPWTDQLVVGAQERGAWTLLTAWSRAVADVNRAPNELDPSVLGPEAADGAWLATVKARAGLGVVPTRVGGRELYPRRLTVRDVHQRVALAHRPYHDALAQLLAMLTARFGFVVLLDLHSMPESAQAGPGAVDVALGDRYGRTADARWVGIIEAELQAAGLVVGRNRPYAGGYVAEAYGRPKHGVHVVQVEFRRGLYMDEARFTAHAGLQHLRSVCDRLFERLAGALRDDLTAGLPIAGE